MEIMGKNTMSKRLKPLPEFADEALYYSITGAKEETIKVLLAHGALVRIDKKKYNQYNVILT